MELLKLERNSSEFNVFPSFAQGRNITVKLADNYKGKVTQSQQHSPMAPVPVQTYGYQQNPYPGTGASTGYGYPQPYGSYPSPAAPIAPYTAQLQYPYNQYGRDTPPSQAGRGGYPYYMPNQ